MYFKNLYWLAIVSATTATIINPTNHAWKLATAMIKQDAGIIIQSVNYIGSSNSSGLYTNAPLPGMPKGVILSTGRSNDSEMPHPIPLPPNFGSVHFNSASSPLCKSRIAGKSTPDASILTVKIKLSNPRTLQANYVLSTQESPTSPFDDVMHLFIDGSEISHPPGTSSSPLSVNSVPASQWISNPGSGLGYSRTTPVISSVRKLYPGTHTITAMVCDVGDQNVDSATLISIWWCHLDSYGCNPPAYPTAPVINWKTANAEAAEDSTVSPTESTPTDEPEPTDVRPTEAFSETANNTATSTEPRAIPAQASSGRFAGRG